MTLQTPRQMALGLCLGACALLVSACGSGSSAGSTSTPTSASTADLATGTSQEPFPSYEPGRKPPASEYKGPLFELSQDYPAAMPGENEIPGFFKTDFRQGDNWRRYMMEVRSYCFEGNTDVEWRVQKNKIRGWYNMPWQHYGFFGREGIHGLTKEAPIQPFQLASTQSSGEGVAYAVGFYNSFGGYAIGQVWKDHAHPNPEYASTKGFPIGTVVCKPLFLNMKPAVVTEQIPFLKDPIQWKAYTTPTFSSTERAVREVTLIQLDFMVRDERSASGWVFGTYQYNGALGHKDRWENLAPVGMMWGNDPQYAESHQQDIPVTNVKGEFPRIKPYTETPINANLTETVINPSSELPPTHLGWQGRLNGPVDNFNSSCMSCHMTSSSPAQRLSPVLTEKGERPPTGTQEWNNWWLQWFQNVGWKNGQLEKFKNAKYALDFSLQLSAALENFYEAEKNITPKVRVRR